MLSASMATPRGRSLINYSRCRCSRTSNKPADAVPNQRPEEFPSFLPLQVERLKDPAARRMATRIERLPVKVSFDDNVILSSCVKPLKRCQSKPVVLLHGFDSSCLEWRYTYPMLEDAGLETWALDILGWGFSDLERLPPCNVASKRDHLYQFWRDYIRKPIVLVGASLGAAVAIDFAVNHPECVSKLVFVDASVFAEGTGQLSKLPRPVAYAGVALLKSIPLRLFATLGTFSDVSLASALDRTAVARLHCLLPWWEDATVEFMLSGGYNVSSDIEKIKQKTLIIWGDEDRIISSKFAQMLHDQIPSSILHFIPGCGHIPHLEKPKHVANLILDFVREGN